MAIKSLDVSGRVYQLAPMPPWEGSEFAAEVAELMAKALAGEAGGIMSARDEIKEGGTVNPTAILSMVTKLLPHIPAKDFTRLARRALSPGSNGTGCSCPDGSLDEGMFDAWFGKHPGDYFPVAIWAIKENAAGFFVKGGPAWSALAAVLLPSTSPKKG